MIAKLHKPTLVLFVLIFFTLTVFAQQEIGVNPVKGVMTAQIPLYAFEIPGFKLPLILSYNASGYKVNESHGRCAGWNFSGGGSVRRILRGLPDEVNSSYDNRLGWMHASQSTLPLFFNPADDNDEYSCTDENSNYLWLNSNYVIGKDLQPDVFVVEAPGLSCRLMLDNQGVLRTIPAQDLKAEFNVNSWNNTNFIITTNKGIKYTFDLGSLSQKKVNLSANGYDLFREEADNYNHGTNSFNDYWYLTKIEVLNEGKPSYINYSYSTVLSTENTEELKVYTKNIDIDTARESKLYEWYRFSLNRGHINSITSSTGIKAVFDGDHRIPTAIRIYYGLETDRPADQDITVRDLMANDDKNKSQSFLMDVTLQGPGCSSKQYKFSYYGLSEDNTQTQLLATFPLDVNSKRVDAWGCYNGIETNHHQAPRIYVYPGLRNTTGVYRPYAIPGYSGETYILPGNDMTPNENTVACGSLSKITYPAGGSSSFEYECNSFLDQDANTEVKGGGLRIKAINHFDGMNSNTIMRTEYIYKTNANFTSGTINMLPAYAISTTSYKDLISGITKSYPTILSSYGANSLDYWNYLTVRTMHDLYKGESLVSYTQVTTKESGNGKVTQVFSPQKSFWDTSTSVLSYTAESCGPGNSPFITNGYNQYPFAPIEYWGGGDLIEELVYNENGTLLKKRELEYEDYYPTPQRIYAIAKDNNFGLLQFSKYYTQIVGKLLKKTQETIYDSNLTGNGLMTQTDYDNSAAGRKLKNILVTNSDNTQFKTSYLYSGDFDNFHTNDQNNPHLSGLMSLLYSNNVRDDVIEKITSLKTNGGSFKVVDAQAKLYTRSTINGQSYAVLSQIKSLKNLDGLIDFSPMQRTESVPYRSLSVDSRYENERTFSDYNNTLLAGTVTSKRTQMAVVSDSLTRAPMLQVNGADLSDIGFYNFDGMSDSTFRVSERNSYNYYKDQYFGRSYKFNPDGAFFKTLTKKEQNGFYKVAFLAKSKSATQVRISFGSSVIGSIPVRSSLIGTIPIIPSEKFKFYEQTIDLSTIATPLIVITTDADIVVDNLILYPADAQFTMSNYDKINGKTMEMNSSGLVKLYEYKDGRLVAERDLQENILKAVFYANHKENSVIPYFASITIANPTKNYVGRTMMFAGAGSCLPGTKYIWNFGDGTTLESFDQNVTHVYLSAATYTVTLTLSHPEYPNNTKTSSLLIRPSPVIDTRICATGIIRFNPCYDYIRYYTSCDPWTDGETESPYGTIFKAWTIEGCAYTRMWQMSYDGVNYVDVGPWATEETLTLTRGEYYDMDVYVRCRITSENCDTVAYTDSIMIEVNCNVY